MRFATRALLLQLLTVVAVVSTSTIVFIVLSMEQLRDEAETSALMIARTIGADSQVRELVAEESADPENPRSEERRVGKECRSRWSPYH